MFAKKDPYKAIEQLHQTDKKASLRGDVKALLSLFCDDAIVIPASGELYDGKEQIRKMIEFTTGFLKTHDLVEYEQDFREVQVIDDHAYEWGFYHGVYVSKADGQEIRGGGRLMRILQLQEDGSWKILRSIWTEDKAE
jgi:uncharacterized protein (TIGR02246 family)